MVVKLSYKTKLKSLQKLLLIILVLEYGIFELALCHDINNEQFEQYLRSDATSLAYTEIQNFKAQRIKQLKNNPKYVNQQSSFWIQHQHTQSKQYQTNLNALTDMLKKINKKAIFIGNPEQNVNFNLNNKSPNMSIFIKVPTNYQNQNIQKNKNKNNNRDSYFSLIIQTSVAHRDIQHQKSPILMLIVNHNKLYRKARALSQSKNQNESTQKAFPQKQYKQQPINTINYISSHQIQFVQQLYEAQQKKLTILKNNDYQLYQIFVQLIQPLKTEEDSKNISFLIQILELPKNETNSNGYDDTNKENEELSQEIVTLLKQVGYKNDKIFLQSLQFWEAVKHHRLQHQENVNFTYFTAAVQIVSIVVVFVFQFVALKNMIQKKVII